MTDPTKTVLIIGASSGIGRVTARLLAADGWNVVLSARSEAGLTAAAAECAFGRGAVLTLPCDVRDRDTVARVFVAATEKFGRIDAVVHTADGALNMIRPHLKEAP